MLDIISGAKEEPYRFLKTGSYELEAGVAERIMERKSRYMVTYHQGISSGVVLCILSVVPLLASGLLELNDVMVVGSVGLLLVIVASGVRMMGRVKGNKMVNMQLSNIKLVDRGTRMVVEELGLPYEEAKTLLLKYGSVKKACDAYRANQ